jgi:outer membrane immunogenic protein
MKRFILTACAGLLAAAVASPSFAADLPRPAYKNPVYVAPFSWSGFYVGINGGYGWGNGSFSDPVAGTFSDRATGWLAGGTLGYNLQTGSWVWGLEGDFDFSTVKATDTAVCGTPGCEIRNRYLATGRGRIGYAWDRWLPFITGGAAYGDLKFTNPAGLSESHSKLGWTAGAGVEYAFMGAWSVKAEYLYVDLGSVTCSPTTCGPSTTIKMPLNIARLGVNYRF